MNVEKPLLRGSLLAGAIAALIAGTITLSHHDRDDMAKAIMPSQIEAAAASFSPDENLEEEDVSIIGSARSTIDVAMYSFTDRRMEEALEHAAGRGVHIRVYRDGLQLRAEEAEAVRRSGQSVTDMLRSIPGIEIKVKSHSVSMHLKSYCVDGKVLRIGSANWSYQGETEQDNDVYLIQSEAVVRKFRGEFNKLWQRPDNTRLKALAG